MTRVAESVNSGCPSCTIWQMIGRGHLDSVPGATFQRSAIDGGTTGPTGSSRRGPAVRGPHSWGSSVRPRDPAGGGGLRRLSRVLRRHAPFRQPGPKWFAGRSARETPNGSGFYYCAATIKSAARRKELTPRHYRPLGGEGGPVKHRRTPGRLTVARSGVRYVDMLSQGGRQETFRMPLRKRSSAEPAPMHPQRRCVLCGHHVESGRY